MEQKRINWEAYKDPAERLRLFREQFAEYLEDLVTDPEFKPQNFSTDLPENVRRGIPLRWNTILRDGAYRVTQDMRLTHDQANEVVSAVFEADENNGE